MLPLGFVALALPGSANVVTFLLPNRQPIASTEPMDWTHFTDRNGDELNLFTILELIGGGVEACGFNGDGSTDLDFTGVGHSLDRVISRRPVSSTATSAT